MVRRITMEKLSLLIPMNGSGERFVKHSSRPKPLIKIHDREMIFWLLDHLDLHRITQVVIPYNSILDQYNFREKIIARYPKTLFRLISLSERTSGAVETISVALSHLPEHELDSNFMIMDCDTFYYEDVIKLYASRDVKNAIFYFSDFGSEELFSYIKVENGRVKEIKEKEKISDFANCGIFCVKDGDGLKKYCSMLLSNGVRQKGEFYTSGIFDLMIKDGISVVPIEVKKFECVGTPKQLDNFVRREA